MAQDLRRGVISFFYHKKGYGFLECEDTKQKVFFHLKALSNVGDPSAMNTKVLPGHKAEFEIQKGSGSSDEAARVILLDYQPEAGNTPGAGGRPTNREDSEARTRSGGARNQRSGPPSGSAGGARSEELSGKVKFWYIKKNYGFIIGDDGNDYYFNLSNLSDAQPSEDLSTLEGERVRFFPCPDRKGTLATDVVRVNPPTRQRRPASPPPAQRRRSPSPPPRPRSRDRYGGGYGGGYGGDRDYPRSPPRSPPRPRDEYYSSRSYQEYDRRDVRGAGYDDDRLPPPPHGGRTRYSPPPDDRYGRDPYARSGGGPMRNDYYRIAGSGGAYDPHRDSRYAPYDRPRSPPPPPPSSSYYYR